MIINSLSAFEAGKVDEIIEKVSEASEGGREGSIGYGPTKVAGNTKKTTNVARPSSVSQIARFR